MSIAAGARAVAELVFRETCRGHVTVAHHRNPPASLRCCTAPLSQRRTRTAGLSALLSRGRVPLSLSRWQVDVGCEDGSRCDAVGDGLPRLRCLAVGTDADSVSFCGSGVHEPRAGATTAPASVGTAAPRHALAMAPADGFPVAFWVSPGQATPVHANVSVAMPTGAPAGTITMALVGAFIATTSASGDVQLVQLDDVTVTPMEFNVSMGSGGTEVVALAVTVSVAAAPPAAVVMLRYAAADAAVLASYPSMTAHVCGAVLPDPLPLFTPTIGINATVLNVQFFAPARWSACRTLMLDASRCFISRYVAVPGGVRASGTAAYGGLVYAWSLAGVEDGNGVAVSTTTAAALASYLAQQTAPMLSVPPAVMPTGVAVTIRVAVTSVATGLSDTRTVRVAIAAVPSPVLAFDGGESRIVFADTPVQVHVDVVEPTGYCSSAMAVQATYSWRWAAQARVGGCLTDPGMPSPSLPPLQTAYVTSSPNTVQFPKYTLPIGGRFVLRATAVLQYADGSNSTASADMVLEVRSREEMLPGTSIVAGVAGGRERRLWSNSSALAFTPSSVDHDGAPVPWRHVWSCVALSPSSLSTTACLSALDGSVLDMASRTSTAGVLSFAAGQLAPGTYFLTLNSSKGVPGGLMPYHGRWATEVLTLNITAVPTIAATVSYPALSTARYNLEDKIGLLGAVMPTAGVNAGSVVYNWSLASHVGTAVDPMLPAMVLPTMICVTGTALQVNAVYRFRLQVTGSGTAAPGVAGLNVVMNGPPTGGIVSSSPTSGTCVSEDFILYTTGWTDSVGVSCVCCRLCLCSNSCACRAVAHRECRGVVAYACVSVSVTGIMLLD